MSKYSQINSEIILLGFVHSLDPDLVDKSRLLEMKSTLDKFTGDLDDSSNHHKINYTVISYVGQIETVSERMGAHSDHKLPFRFAKALEKDELSYINFSSSLKNVQDVNLYPLIRKALEY